MIRTCAETGRMLTEEEHILQSLKIILTTPTGTLLHQRDFGCRIWHYIDQPLLEETKAQMQMAVLEAIDKWEPRVKTEKVMVLPGKDLGHVTVVATVRSKSGKQFKLDVTL